MQDESTIRHVKIVKEQENQSAESGRLDNQSSEWFPASDKSNVVNTQCKGTTEQMEDFLSDLNPGVKVILAKSENSSVAKKSNLVSILKPDLKQTIELENQNSVIQSKTIDSGDSKTAAKKKSRVKNTARKSMSSCRDKVPDDLVIKEEPVDDILTSRTIIGSDGVMKIISGDFGNNLNTEVASFMSF